MARISDNKISAKLGSDYKKPDAITRIDRVLQSPSLSQPSAPKHPKDSSVTLDQVTFSYDGTKNAVENISLSIGAGQTNGAFDQMAVLKHEGNRVHQLVFVNVLHIDP